MQNKIVAKIKGSTWSSISFVVKDVKKLAQLLELLEDVKVVESSGFYNQDGDYKSVNHEEGSLSISLESAVEIHDADEINCLKADQKIWEAKEVARKEAEEAEKVGEEPPTE